MPLEEIMIVLFYLNNLASNHLNEDIKESIVNFISSDGKPLFLRSILRKYDAEYDKIRDLKRFSYSFLGSHRRNEYENKFSLIKQMIADSNPPNILPAFNYGIRLGDRISDIFQLTEIANRDIIRLIAAKNSMPILNDLLRCLNLNYYFEQKNFILLSAILGHNYEAIVDIFRQDSDLIRKGLFDLSDNDSRFCPSGSLLKMISNHQETFISPKTVLLGKPTVANLHKSDYDYLNDDYDFIAKLLSRALATKAPGVNILLYGPPGTGKTEIAKAICGQLKVDLYSISEESKNCRSDSRLSELNMAKTLIDNDVNTVLMIDEAEDILSLTKNQEMVYGKLYLNRLLENNQIPAIWITNSINMIHSAVIRRFSYALEMRMPPVEARERILGRMFKKAKINMPKPEIGELASDYELSPAYMALAVRSAKLLGDNEAIRKTLDSLDLAATGRVKDRKSQPKNDFYLELANTDLNLATLADRITSGGIEGFSLCLYGAPGTGKSAYVRYLAERMRLKVLHKRASDLLGMFVGETEANIANAFKEAKREKKFLVFDEADSFLQDRRKAIRSWEVTAVNEMLTWMESHPYPFACTTNLMENLDPASLRRFTFKIKYDFLTRAQAKAAFKHFFGVDYPLSLDGLAPGDFALVAKKVKTLAITDPAAIADYLRKEVEFKEGRIKTIGFTSRP